MPPAEGAVAVLRLFARADDHGDVPLNTSGHSFLTITNVSEQDINVGGLQHQHHIPLAAL